MSFGRGHEESELDYAGYLRLAELTDLQELLSDPPQHDEMLFIIVHQTYELWFKQILHEIDSAVERIEDDDVFGAEWLLRRCVEIQRVLVAQVTILETMAPADFLAFRDHLHPASGFQSVQFRELECVSGQKRPEHLDNYPESSEARRRLERRLRAPTLMDTYMALLRRRGFDVSSPDARLEALLTVYRNRDEHRDVYMLAESMIEYDEMFVLWRLRHIAMVERMIGTSSGTGGTAGVEYLLDTTSRKFFPELWELRSRLSRPSDSGAAQRPG